MAMDTPSGQQQPTEQQQAPKAWVTTALVFIGLFMFFIGQGIVRFGQQFMLYPIWAEFISVLLYSLGGALIFFVLFKYGKSWQSLAVTPQRPVAGEVQLKEALDRIAEDPNKVGPIWNLAQLKLDQYLDRNLKQINYIFWLSVVVMTVGFGFVLFGVYLLDVRSNFR